MGTKILDMSRWAGHVEVNSGADQLTAIFKSQPLYGV